MVSVGIDVSKEKSTVCFMKPYGEVLFSRYDVFHTENDLMQLVDQIKGLNDEVKVVMESTGAYHYPILAFLKRYGIFVSVVNAYLMKKYASVAIRKGKTDTLDSIEITNYGIDYWFRLVGLSIYRSHVSADERPKQVISKLAGTYSRVQLSREKL